MGIFKYLGRAMTVMGVLGEKVPAAMADGQVTVKEGMEILSALFEAFGVKLLLDKENMADITVNVEKIKGKLK